MEKLIGLIGIVCAIWVIYEVWANHKYVFRIIPVQ